MKSPSASHSRKAIASPRSSSGIGGGLLPVLGDHCPHPREHRRPVGDGAPYFGEERLEPLDQEPPPLDAVDSADMDLNEALADRPLRYRPGAVICGEAAVSVSGDADDRVGDEAEPEAEGLEFAERRIKQERHVLVEDADDGHPGARRAGLLRPRLGDVDDGFARRPFDEERIGIADESGEVLGAVDSEILETHTGEEVAGQRTKPVVFPFAATERAPREADQPVAFARLGAHAHPPFAALAGASVAAIIGPSPLCHMTAP